MKAGEPGVVLSASSGPRSVALLGHPLPELSQREAPGLDTNSEVPHHLHSEYLRAASCRRSQRTFQQRTAPPWASACALSLARLRAATCWPSAKAGEPGVVLSVNTSPKSEALPGDPRTEFSQRRAAGFGTNLQIVQGLAPGSKVPHHMHSE